MVQVPEKYVKRIIGAFGKEGENWFNNLDGLIKKYEKAFEIEDLHYLTCSMNLLFEGYSNKLQKEIILKLCRPMYAVLKEADMLEKYGDLACQCFYKNEEDRVLVLEKLYPGNTIKQIPKREDRAKCFAKLMKQTVLDIDKGDYSIYAERIKKGFLLAMQNEAKYGETARLVPIAHQYFQEVQSLGKRKYLLHGDLGHGNIIKSGDTWKIIDPQGVIAEEIFEVIKFTRAEIEHAENVKQAIEETMYYLSQEIPYSKELIAKVTFIELVRVNCWRIGENDKGENVDRNLMLAKEVLKYYRKNQQ